MSIRDGLLHCLEVWHSKELFLSQGQRVTFHTANASFFSEGLLLPPDNWLFQGSPHPLLGEALIVLFNKQNPPFYVSGNTHLIG